MPREKHLARLRRTSRKDSRMIITPSTMRQSINKNKGSSRHLKVEFTHKRRAGIHLQHSLDEPLFGSQNHKFGASTVPRTKVHVSEQAELQLRK